MSPLNETPSSRSELPLEARTTVSIPIQIPSSPLEPRFEERTARGRLSYQSMMLFEAVRGEQWSGGASWYLNFYGANVITFPPLVVSPPNQNPSSPSETTLEVRTSGGLPRCQGLIMFEEGQVMQCSTAATLDPRFCETHVTIFNSGRCRKVWQLVKEGGRGERDEDEAGA